MPADPESPSRPPDAPEDPAPKLAPLWLGPIAPDVADRATFPFSKDPEAYYYDLPPGDPAYQAFLAELAYLPAADIARIKLAVRFSDWAHRGQTRASGEPYVTHPLCVAGGIAEWRLDADTVCAALLHDVLEDTYIAKRELARHFGQGVADLVDGLTKLDKLQFHSHLEAQASNFRKMLLATARDIRVILIKLADRLHNLRTMAAMRPDKRRRIAQETLEIYAPIANRLGLYKVFRTLQDISFSLIHPWRAQAITRAVDAACGDRRDFFAQIEEAIAQKMQSEGIEAAVFGREKGLYSIYLKMQRKLKAKESRPFRRIYDLYGFRVIVHEERDCYLALGALHALYKPREGRFKDYIANEKSNGYRSLHTTLTGPGGTPLEIQVRTEEMDHVAQTGIASHLLYKDGGSDEELRLKTHKWLQSLLEMQDEDAVEFFENVKIDLFPDEVYVFTPQGEIKALPQGATPIDMAYAIHTDVGNHCQAARINHEAASLRMELQNGDVVEIITSPEASPDPSWIAYARTGWARNRIRHCLKKSHPDDCAALGKKLLSRELKSLGLALSEISEPAWQQILKASGNRAPDEVYIDIALGKRLAAVVARRLLALAGLPAKQSVRSLSIRGTEGSAVHLASCCLPVPGEPVIGSIKKAQGVVVHARDCPAAAKMQGGQGKWIDVEWAAGADEFFNTRIAVEAEAGKKQQDLLVAELAVAISEAGANINDLSRALDAEKGRVHLSFIVQVHSLSHLQKLLATLGQKPGVQSAARAYALPS